jgi:hypothetical protein
MDLSSIEKIIRKQVPNAQDSEVELYLDSVDRVLSRGGDYSDMSEDDVVEDFEYYIQSRTDIDESNIEEGWKEWAIGSLMTLTALAGIGKVYIPKTDQLDSRDKIELTQNAYADALRKMSEEDVDSVYRQVVQSDIEDDLVQNELSFHSKTTPATARAAWPAIQRASLKTAIARNIDRFAISKDGTVVFISNPGGITAIKENKPTTKMKKSELKEMIKAAFLSEADFTSGQDDDAAPAIASMYDPLYEAEEESLDDILARIIGTKADPYMAEDLYEAEEEEEEIEVDAEEKTEKPANDSIVVDKRIVSLSSLPSDTRKILDSLETLRAQAEEFGDQKFITQVGNTITFFTRDFVVAGDEPTKAKVDESLEMIRMRKIAGLLTEDEYSKALLRENLVEKFSNPKIQYLIKLYKEIGDQFPEENIASNNSIMTLEGEVSIETIENMFDNTNLMDIDREELKDYLKDSQPGEQDI